MFLSPNVPEGDEISIMKTIVLIWKWKAHFTQLHNLVHYFCKKISQGACFFTVVHGCTKSLKEPYKKIYSALKLPLYGLAVVIDMNTGIYIQKKAGVSKHCWKKIMQLLWPVVTYLLKNIKHKLNMIFIVLNVWGHLTLLKFAANFLKSLQFEHKMNLTL